MAKIIFNERPIVRRRISRRLGYPVRIGWRGDGVYAPWYVGVVVPDLRADLAQFCKDERILFPHGALRPQLPS